MKPDAHKSKSSWIWKKNNGLLRLTSNPTIVGAQFVPPDINFECQEQEELEFQEMISAANRTLYKLILVSQSNYFKFKEERLASSYQRISASFIINLNDLKEAFESHDFIHSTTGTPYSRKKFEVIRIPRLLPGIEIGERSEEFLSGLDFAKITINCNLDPNSSHPPKNEDQKSRVVESIQDFLEDLL